MVFSGVSMSKDLGRGPMDLSPRVGGGKAPERPGDQRSSPLSHDPLRVGHPHQINPRMGCPTHKGSNGRGGSVFCPLVIGSTSLD
ncbi:Uncharacterised protein [Chlamydia trachomatis]|nr:Uncharacterised protein [Chlamydia trachomatis]